MTFQQKLAILALLSPAMIVNSLRAQTTPTKEYIRLGGRVIATENIVVLPTVTVTPAQGASVASTGVPPGSLTINAPTGIPWTATSTAPSWLTISGGTGGGAQLTGVGPGSLTWNVADNIPAPQPLRNAAINVTGNFATVNFPVSQAASSASLNMQVPQPNLPAGGGSGTVTVTSGLGATAWTLTSSQSWLTFPGGSSSINGTGTDAKTFSYSTNSSSLRTATLTLTSGGVTLGTQTLTQAAQGGAPTLSLSPTGSAVLISRSRPTATVNVTSNTNWVATPLAGWIHVQGGSGIQNGQFTYTVDANDTASQRSGIIQATAGTVTQNFNVTQNAAQSITVVPVNPQNILVGQSFQFNALIDGVQDGNAPVTWAIGCCYSNVSVSSTGLFVAYSTQGANSFSYPVTASFSPTGLSNTTYPQVVNALPSSPPIPYSVTPNSGTGTGATFSVVVQDNNPGLAADIGQEYWRFGVYSVSGGNSGYDCNFNITLENLSPPWVVLNSSIGYLGVSGYLNQPQCEVDAQHGGKTSSGANLTINLPVVFRPGNTPAGTRYIFVRANTVSGPSFTGSNEVILGTYTVGQAPSVTLLSPASGAGPTATFTGRYTNPSTTASLSFVDLIVNSSATLTYSCVVRYRPSQNKFYLLTDAGAEGTGYTPGTTFTQPNTQCILNGSGSSATTSGNDLTVVLPITFKTSYKGSKLTYLMAQDSNGVSSSYQQSGSWTVDEYPTGVSVTPPSGSGMTSTVTFTFGDPNGSSDLEEVYGLLNASATLTSGCAIDYKPGPNTLSIVGTAGTLTPGGAGTLTNGLCTLSGPSSSVATSGATLSVTAGLTFDSSFQGAKNVYLYARDTSQLEILPSVIYSTWKVAAGAPVFSPTPGTYASSISVSMSSPTPGAVIRYTTDGNTPTSSSSVYSSPITVSTTTPVMAFASASGLQDSVVSQATYTIVRDLILDGLSISSGTANYQAINSVTANAVIINGAAAVTFTTGNFIELKPGFHVTAGTAATTFHAFIDPTIH